MLATLYHGPEILLLDGAELTEGPLGSLDAYSFEVLVPGLNWKAELASHGYNRNALLPPTHGLYAMWISDWVKTGADGTRARIKCSCLGLAEDSEKRKISFGANSEIITIGPSAEAPAIKAGAVATSPTLASRARNMTWDPIMGAWSATLKHPTSPSTGGGGGEIEDPAWNLFKHRPTIATTFFTTTRPTGRQTGTIVVPPETMHGATNDFEAEGWLYMAYRRNHRSGWILEQDHIDQLFYNSATGAGLWAVTQTMTQHPEKVPI